MLIRIIIASNCFFLFIECLFVLQLRSLFFRPTIISISIYCSLAVLSARMYGSCQSLQSLLTIVKLIPVKAGKAFTFLVVVKTLLLEVRPHFKRTQRTFCCWRILICSQLQAFPTKWYWCLLNFFPIRLAVWLKLALIFFRLLFSLLYLIS